MQTPFTAEQFLEVMAQYNQAVWPAQVGLLLVGVVLVGLAVRSRPGGGRWIAAGLALLWAWMAVAYHWLFFTRINPAAWLFGGLFLLQALLFLFAGAARRRLAFGFRGDVGGVAGAVFLAYALVIYPVIGALAGHGFPTGPTFGLPCPTTIATFGLLLWAARPVPWWLLLVPLLWSAVGGSAAFLFGIPEDYALPVAGVVGTAMILARGRRQRARANPTPAAAATIE